MMQGTVYTKRFPEVLQARETREDVTFKREETW
jgi:hypothetical protein